mgnify:CR=1 FL=1
MKKYYQQKKIWITGASSGIGKAMAEELATFSARLVISGRRSGVLEKLALELVQKGATEVRVLAFDLESELERQKAAEQVEEFWQYPDIVILSGGLSQRSLVADTQMNVYRRLMEVDYLANVQLSKFFLQQWLQADGQVVVISSLVGKIQTPYRSGYAAAKHALHGFYESLRAEHPKLKINIICPGFIHTQVSVNALTGDNSALGIMDEAQRKGMPAAEFASKALRAIQGNKSVALIGGKEVLAVYLFRFLPKIFRRIISKAKVR